MDLFCCIADLVLSRDVFHKKIWKIYILMMREKIKYYKKLKLKNSSETSEDLREEQIDRINENFNTIKHSIKENENNFEDLKHQFEQKMEVIRVHTILNKAEHYRILMEL